MYEPLSEFHKQRFAKYLKDHTTYINAGALHTFISSPVLFVLFLELRPDGRNRSDVSDVVDGGGLVVHAW